MVGAITKTRGRARLPKRTAASEAREQQAVSSAEGRRRFILLVTALLFCFGMVMVMSASSGASLLLHDDPWFFAKKQLMWGVIGMVGMFVAMRVPLGLMAAMSPMMLYASIALLFLVFVPGLGQEVNGATRWLVVGGFTMQPSELVKLALIIYLARHLAFSELPTTWREFWQSRGGFAFAIAAVIFLQRDLGSAMIVGSVIIAMYAVSGIHGKVLTRALAPFIGLIILGILSEEYRRERFLAFLNPWDDAQGAGFQLVQALIAIGSGGPFGVGLGHSVQKIHYVPEAHTDMIFSIIAEELGLLGAALVIMMFVSLTVVGFRIATRARDPFHALLAVGLTIALCGQAALNIAGNVGVLPLTGVPLPLVSYGGSSLVITLTSLGLLANVAVASRRSARGQPRADDD